MKTREELIEEAATTLRHYGYGHLADGVEDVFEKAHAPTDDEQFAKSFGRWSPDEVARNPRAAAEVIERLRSRVIDGFRRAPQAEPTDAQVHAALNSWYMEDPQSELSDYSERAIQAMRAALRAAGGVR